jgi:hypothetical protein
LAYPIIKEITVIRIFALSIFILLSLECFSQILNIEKYRIDKDTANVWSGNIGFGFSSKKQQNTVTTLNANSNLVYLSQKHSYLQIGNIKFIAVEGSQLISEGYTHFRSVLNRRKFISYEPFLQWQYDLGRGLEKRELYGFAIRFNFIRTKKFHVAANTGCMYEHEVWKGNVLRFPVVDRPGFAETHFIKSTSNFTARGDVSNNVYILFVIYYQARFDRFFDPRLITDTQINFIISKRLTINNQFVSTFDDLPILTENRFVYSLNTNLMIKF